MSQFEQQNNIATTAIDFSSLYSALQHNYEKSDILNTIIQLLNMYRPEDGIAAYEHVLRKMQDLLKDCDFYKKQLLLSMIPLPKNASYYTIQEVFHTITGFIKLNLQEINTFQNMFDVKDTNKIMDDRILSSKPIFVYDNSASTFNLLFPEEFPFCSTTENEIATAYNHSDPPNHWLNTDSKNWLDRNNKYQMSTCRQYLLNKKYYTPASNNSESYFCYSSKTVYQDSCSIKTTMECDNDGVTADLCEEKTPAQLNDFKYETKSGDDNVLDKDIKSDISQAVIDVDQNAAIKNNIQKMDVCCEDQNIYIDADDFLATVRDRLKMSLSNFLKRAREGTRIELSAFPHTRLNSQTSSSNSEYFASKDRKPATVRKVLKKDFASGFSSADSKNCLLSKRQNVDVNLEKDHRASDEQTKQKVFTCVTGSQKPVTGSKELNKVTQLLPQNNLNYTTERKALTIQRKENDTKESTYRCKMVRARSNDVNSESNPQAQSMSELAAYKKQYYDTLLNVRRAKAAVTNSLASSSHHLAAYDDPYYSNYAYQQQHLSQVQRQFTVKPQFSTCPTTISGLPSTHDIQYSWARSDCKYLLLEQLRLLRQTSPMYAGNHGGWIHRCVGPMHPYTYMPNENDQTKQCIRRKSLEDIVGKLKEIECNSANK